MPLKIDGFAVNLYGDALYEWDDRLNTDDEIIDKISHSLTKRPGYLLRRCLQETSGEFDKTCRDIGITERQYDYLFALDQATKLSQGALSKLLGVDRSTNTLVIRILEKKGLVSRKVDQTDSRRKIVEITKAGRQAFEAAEAGAQVAALGIKRRLTDNEYEQLLRHLGKVTDAITSGNPNFNPQPHE